MKKIKRGIYSFLCLISFLLLSGNTFAQTDSVKVHNYLNTILDNESLLNQFFMYMPKGGDIHNHLTGSAYAETYFAFAVKDGLWVDMNKGKLYRTQHDAQKAGIVSPIRLTPDMDDLHNTRMRLIDLWSVRNYKPAEAALGADEYFFGTFGLFSAVAGSHLVELLHELKNRAARENVQYLEIMAIAPKIDANSIDNLFGRGTYQKDNEAVSKAILTNDVFLADTLARIFKKWDSNADMQKMVKKYIHWVDSLDMNSNLVDDPYAPVCHYQAYASRNSAPLNVFSQLYMSFKACVDSGNKRIVGVNLVSAEDGEQSMMYYRGHMKMFDYLKKAVGGKVKTSLHAGEMTIGLVKPEDLGFHIREAVYTAKANRIGHGVDIAFENGSISLLNELRTRDIPIEINLVSNEFILGVKDDHHPFPLYFKAGVPLVISTDDPGILRTNLAEQYTLLALRYKLNYYDVKQLVRNSIRYCFADDATKKQLLNKLNSEFARFEANWSENLQMVNW